MSESPAQTSALLPPRFVRGHKNASTGSSPAASPPQPLFPPGIAVETVDGLLPPRRISQRFSVAQVDRTIGRDGPFVILPDASGGFRKVNNQTVHSRNGMEAVRLRTRTRGQALRYRIFINLVAIALGLAILFGVFWLAINGYI
jgi:hypothetical protein